MDGEREREDGRVEVLNIIHLKKKKKRKEKRASRLVGPAVARGDGRAAGV